MLRLNELDQEIWRLDVISFERYKKIYEGCSNKNIKNHCMRNLIGLQKRWPNHKLGEIPNEQS